MRNDERYRQKPMSNQLEIFGLGADGEQDMADARAWIGEHPRAWDFMVEQATVKGGVAVLQFEVDTEDSAAFEAIRKSGEEVWLSIQSKQPQILFVSHDGEVTE